MKYIIDTKPYVGAKYSGLDKVFAITALLTKDNDQWVEYINEDTNQSYSCRLEAFLARYIMLP